MAEGLQEAPPGTQSTYEATPAVRRRFRSARTSSSQLTLRDSRRAWNRDGIGLLSDLLCECTRPSCQERIPAVADAHRRIVDQFAVAPAHVDGGIVVRV